MKAPAGLVGAALLLWGLAIGWVWLGALLGLAFELVGRAARPSLLGAARLGRVSRWGLLLALAALPAWLALQGLPQGLYAWLRWLPVALLPLAVLPMVLPQPTWAALRHALQPGAPRKADGPEERVDLTHALSAVTLAAAGTGTAAAAGPPGWLYAGYVGIVGWALLARQTRARRAVAAGLLAVAAALGFGVQAGLHALQGQVEEWSTDLIAQWLSAPPDAFRERTRIGELGRIKLSDRIVMRVVADGPRAAPLLLREAVFDRYGGGEWQSARRQGVPVKRDVASEAEPSAAASAWRLAEGPASTRLLVRRTLPGGSGLLPLPLGTRRIGALPAEAMDRLPAGAVRVHGGPRFIAMQVDYDEAAEPGEPDPALDLDVPVVLRDALARVADEERLRRADAAATLAAVRAFFEAKFAYSLDLGRRGGADGRTVADFLLRDHRGHCEYFATATTLLLRQLGLPARYVGGYSVQEYSPREQAFVVRARHAHAWTQVWVDGRWLNVDTTPSRWAEFEQAEARSAFGPLLDWASWFVERVLQAGLDALELGLPRGSGPAALAAAVAALGLALAWMARRRWQARARARGPGSNIGALDEVARAWERVEHSVAAAGHARERGETVRAWTGRLGAAAVDARPWQPALRDLGEAYYRVRFDPEASATLRAAFIENARAWLPPPAR